MTLKRKECNSGGNKRKELGMLEWWNSQVIQIKSFPRTSLVSRRSEEKALEKSYQSSIYGVYTLHCGMLIVENECPADQGNNLSKFLWTIVTKCSIYRNYCPLEVTSLTKGQYFFQLHISQPGCVLSFCSFWRKKRKTILDILLAHVPSVRPIRLASRIRGHGQFSG